MNRLCIHKATKKIIEMQSGGDDRPDLMESRLNTLKLNALNARYNEADIEVKWVTDAEYAEAIEQDPVTIANKQKEQSEQARIAAKAEAILTNLPTWAQVSTAVDNISSLAEAKVFIKKLARIVYWLAKDKEA